jgi:chaperonin GroES
MRKDTLAAGARRATFAGGSGDGDIFRNVAPEDTREDFVPDTTATPISRKAFRPLGTDLLVRRTEAKNLSDILITDTLEKEQPCEGDVLAIGNSVTNVSVGDTVVFGKYSGQEFKLNGEVLLIMKLEEVRGIIAEEQPADDSPSYGCISGHIGRA